jgi:hypothetical protein
MTREVGSESDLSGPATREMQVKDDAGEASDVAAEVFVLTLEMETFDSLQAKVDALRAEVEKLERWVAPGNLSKAKIQRYSRTLGHGALMTSKEGE